MDADCILCAGSSMDGALMVEEAWSDELWRLTTVSVGELAGYSYLAPRRHIPHVMDLDGEEASTFGTVLAACSTAVARATGADLSYVYVFGGGVDHFHVHIAPHRHSGSPLIDDPIKGAKHQQRLASGQEVWVSDRYPLQPRELMSAAIESIRMALGGSETEDGEDLA